jgi:lipid-A-disaccharide synthase
LKVKFISLVNLVAGKEIVRELVADTMTVDNMQSELKAVLLDNVKRQQMLDEYDRMIKILGPSGASKKTATKMVELLKNRK